MVLLRCSSYTFTHSAVASGFLRHAPPVIMGYCDWQDVYHLWLSLEAAHSTRCVTINMYHPFSLTTPSRISLLARQSDSTFLYFLFTILTSRHGSVKIKKRSQTLIYLFPFICFFFLFIFDAYSSGVPDLFTRSQHSSKIGNDPSGRISSGRFCLYLPQIKTQYLLFFCPQRFHNTLRFVMTGFLFFSILK